MRCLKFLPVLLAIAGLCLLFGPGQGVAQAQAACEQDNLAGPVRIDRNVLVGGYKLCVEAEASKLSLGAASVSVAVLNAITEAPVYDARVVIHNRHGETGESGWATALPVPERPEIYRVARMRLDYPGPVGFERGGGRLPGPSGNAGRHGDHSAAAPVLGRLGGLRRDVGFPARRGDLRGLEHTPGAEAAGGGQCGLGAL